MSGILGQADVPAVTETDVYTVGASLVSGVIISICNRNSAVTSVRVSLRKNNEAASDKQYIEYDVSIPAAGVLERTGVILSAGDVVTVYSDTTNVSVNVFGIEEVL